MLLGGLQKMTLIDYPGKIAATVFTVGCNFRCPFCHNPELVLSSRFTVSADDDSLEKEFFEFLKTRQGKLDGVCITGGEPTLQSDLVEFMTRIKELGFAVKLDSNGTRPDILKIVIDKKIVDYLAMDIKSDLINYEKVCQTKVDLERIKTSVDLIKNSGVNYEFRTTVVPGLHQEKDFKEIVKWLSGGRRYVLQRYQDYGKILDDGLRKRIAGESKPDLEKIKQMFKGAVGEVIIR
jgi:pyruvate formate lyase activating enzyme